MPKKRDVLIRKTLDDLSGRAFKRSRAWTEAEKRMYAYRYQKILSFLPKLGVNDRILEIGLCGGALAFTLKRLFPQAKVYTIEHPMTYRLYTKNFLSRLNHEGIVLRQCNLVSDSLPWPEEKFDLVVLSEVIEHLVPAITSKTIGEIQRILKKKKIFLLSTPNIASLLKRLNLLRGRNPVIFDGFLHEGSTYGHIREYTLAEVENLLQGNGFKILRKAYATFDRERSLFVRIEALIANIFPPLGNGIIVLAGKI